MKIINIKLSSIEDIRTLVDSVTLCPYDVELSSGSYTIDAKSIMGIFGLDLSKSITMTAFTDDCSELLERIGDFVLSQE
ncbi:MAG: HPr family phosphocarrier protein [Ruminococcaceae bacterium]|nr:HPr family phosphocarrier protein [Oscillospiraceae bacterium]